MPRKLATQVPEAMSRIIQSNLQPAPTWYRPVLANPPPVIPPRQTIARSRPSAKSTYTDLPPRPNATKPRPAEIMYEADRVRRQFFADFPFEALRPVSLVEGKEIRPESPVRGKTWTQLVQRGRYPSVEDVVEFTLNLHETQGFSLSDAYARATGEFVALRAQHEMASLAAQAEARHYGASFALDQWDRTFWKEGGRLYRTADMRDDKSEGPLTAGQSTKFKANKKWTYSVSPLAKPGGEFTAGKAYVERWSLPPPPSTEGKKAGDLVSAIAAPAEEKSEDEMDDAELMEAILGKA